MHCTACEPQRLLLLRHCPRSTSICRLYHQRDQCLPQYSQAQAFQCSGSDSRVGLRWVGSCFDMWMPCSFVEGIEDDVPKPSLHRLTRFVNTNQLSATANLDGRFIHRVRCGTSSRHALLFVPHSASAVLSSLPWRKVSTVYREPLYARSFDLYRYPLLVKK